MKEWLLEKYSSSTSKHCPHEPSPTIEADPIRIHLDPNAIPKPAFTAATVPIHLRKAVSEQIQQDVAKCIIEPSKSGVLTVWQARMHVVSKPYGTLRRTVDFHHLNKFCKRVTQHVVPRYKQARLALIEVTALSLMPKMDIMQSRLLKRIVTSQPPLLRREDSSIALPSRGT